MVLWCERSVKKKKKTKKKKLMITMVVMMTMKKFGGCVTRAIDSPQNPVLKLGSCHC